MAKPKKILGHFGYFALPDDFKGSTSDAFRLLAEYIESPTAKAQRFVSEQKEVSDFESARFQDFWDEFHQSGRRHTALTTIQELRDGAFVELPDGGETNG